jgi:hypothetical protein
MELFRHEGSIGEEIHKGFCGENLMERERLEDL